MKSKFKVEGPATGNTKHQGETMNLVRIVCLDLAVLLPAAWTVAKAAGDDTTTETKTTKKKKSKKKDDGSGKTDTETKTETKTDK